MPRPSAPFRHAAAVALAAWLLPGEATPAEPVACSDPRISVASDDPALVAPVCGAAAAARPMLEQCHLRQVDPVTITVVEHPSPANAHALGRFVLADRSVEVLTPERLHDIAEPDGPSARVAPMTLFRSVVVHELTHALIAEHPCARDLCAAEQEYMASVMQFHALAPDARQTYLAAFPQDGRVTQGELNDILYMFDPVHFAVKAWRHFSAPGNGCAFFRKLLDRETSLRLPEL